MGGTGGKATLLKFSPNGALLSASLLGGLPDNTDGNPNATEYTRGIMPSALIATRDGGSAMALPTESYVPAGDATGKPDWWIVKTDANVRVQGFQDLTTTVPLTAFFTVTDITQSGVATDAFQRLATPELIFPGYGGVGFSVRNLTPETGINQPLVQVQAAPFTGPVLPATGLLNVTAPTPVQSGLTFNFETTQTSAADGLSMHVQSSLTPYLESSWTDLPGGGRMIRLNGDRWTLATGNVPSGNMTYFRALSAATGLHGTVSMDSAAFNILPGEVSEHGPFFTGESALANGVYYLQFPGGNPFGYYSYLSDPHYVFHQDLGYEFVFDANDGRSGVYLYDFKSNGFFYTSPSFPFPYLYDFSLGTTLYYYQDPGSAGRYDTDGVRYFFRFDTGQIFSK